MSHSLILRAFLAWILLAVCGVLNGVVREYTIRPLVGADAGHVISTAILCSIILIVSWLFVKRVGLTARHDLLMVGAIWLGLTVLFEFGFGHYVMGNPWERLLADYNIFRGRVWSLVLLTELLGPLLMARLHR
jgi:hypothetical protein